MKNINVHIVAVITVLIALVTFNWQYGSETFVFFGFAENKELEVRLEHPVSVKKVFVTAGHKVKTGDILLEVTRSSLELAAGNLNHEVAKLQSQLKIWESNLKANIRSLEAQKLAKQSEIQSQIEQLESQMSINKSLVEGLASIDPIKDLSGKSPNIIKIEGLKKELNLAVGPLNAEIRKLENELYARENPLKIQIEQIEEELGYVHQEEENLTIYAPSDGVIGTVFCKTGEQHSSFTTLMTFYEENPNQVKGYVLESLILNVHLNDSVLVQSAVQSGSQCMGKVIGMGSRIVEIPERLRKNPTFKTYGREVQIEIPSDNDFLQKEKVVLKIPREEQTPIKIFTPPKAVNPNIVGKAS